MDEYMPPLDESAAFIKEIDPTKPLPIDIEALQALKYESEDPDEAARSYKEEGNYHFKKQEWQTARDSYTQGLQARPTDKGMQTALLTNRAAAEFKLGNYGSCFRDCERAKRIAPDSYKAHLRGAQSLLAVEKLAQCQSWCEEALLQFPDDAELLRLSSKSRQSLASAEAKLRRRAAAERRQRRDVDAMSELLRRRGVGVRSGSERLDIPADMRLHVEADASGRRQLLLLPVLLLYPESGETDCVQRASEDGTLLQLADTVLREPPSWDSKRQYRPEVVEFFAELPRDGEYRRLRRGDSLMDVLQSGVCLTGCVLVLTVLSRESPAFLETWLAANSVL